MHPEARHFLGFIVAHYPEYFRNKRVLDVGAGDINGNNRMYFTNCEYHGNDVYPSPNVTIVSKTCDLPFEDHSFDTIISSECFEHDMYYAESLQRIVRMLKPGGLFLFTCATTGRAEHGTKRTSPECSFTCMLDDDAWCNYYKNLTEQDVQNAIPCKEVFGVNYSFYVNNRSKDLYFYGFTKDNESVIVPKMITYTPF